MLAALAEAPRIDFVDPAADDRACVARTLQGDAEGFAALVTRYERPVYHLAFRLLRDREEARDITQEAFLKAFRALASFRPEAKFSTWLFAIAYHAGIDRLARRKRFSESEIPERADLAPGPEEEAILSERARRLRAAVERLPLKYRSIVTLFHLQGKRYDEIADVLGLPLGTVKTHLFRAKEQLRSMLEPDEVY